MPPKSIACLGNEATASHIMTSIPSDHVKNLESRSLRIIHMPNNLGNQPWVLASYEREAGASSELVVHYSPPEFGYPAHRVIGQLGDDSDQALRVRTEEALRAPLDYDVLHSYYGRTLFTWDDLRRPSPFPMLDVKIAKAMGKKIFFTLQGCDVRLAGRSHARNPTTACAPEGCSLFRTCVDHIDAKRLALIDSMTAIADKIFYLNPELGHYLPRGEFLPYASVDIDAIDVVPPSMSGPVRIVHAPSNRSIKGTDRILEALSIVAQQRAVEIILIEGISHEEAMKKYRSADLVVDQILLGWYGGLAVEVMAMGKITLCTLREKDFCNVPEPFLKDLAIINISPDDVAGDIIKLIDNRSSWGDLSQKSRRFVERWHHPRVLAQRMLACYRDPSIALMSMRSPI